MIPLTLRIQNFLSYGSPVQTIDFSHYKLICLSGKNGHGKSALLDAMTWALWGQARKTGSTSKADSGILKLGQTDVMVIFDFIFNTQTYRVKRVFSTKYGKPKAHLDFGTYNCETDYFTPLTEKTMRKTQECVDKTLGLDYEAFINSSFLRQGQANEFSKKSPKDRKEVLASILGLHRYEKAKKLALEQGRKTTQEKEHLEKLALHIATECQQGTELEKDLVITTTRLTEIIKQEAGYASQQQTFAQERNTLSKKQQDQKILLFEAKQKQKEIETQTAQFHTTAQQWKQTHAQLLRLPDKQLLEKRKQDLVTKTTDYQEMLQKSLACKDEYLQCKEAEQDLLHKLKNTHEKEFQDKRLQLERLKSAHNVEQQKNELYVKEITLLQEQQKHCEQGIESLKKTVNPAHLIGDTKDLQKTFERYKEYYQKWIEQGNWVARELKSLQDKQHLSQDSTNPSCPLCEQNLSQARKRFLYKKFADQEHFLKHRLERLKKLVKRTKDTLHEQHATLEASKQIDELLKKQNEFLPALKLKEKEYKTHTQNILESEKQYIQEQMLVKKHEEKTLQAIQTDTTYSVLKKKRETAQLTIKKLTPAPELQVQLAKETQKVHTQLQQWSTLDKQQALQEERKKQVHELGLSVKDHKKKQTQLATRLKEFDTLDTQFNELEKNEKIFREQTQNLASAKEKILQLKGGLESQIKKLTQRAKEQKEYEQQAKKQEIKVQEYQAISQALGKDGIQALLIEDALPEIEQEANELLSRLTDNQTHIFIESLRDLKKGGTRETLDINISDSSGIRPYEMFSGGEAFRLDFALRIAISKLLARRAGTSLQTLIIDEGFGSQDEEGLSRIMDVLYKIQDDFEKIIIVSHLATMKDQFPVHFMVSKEPQGSRVTIKEQG
jgi:DNA repair protein SbcC/Rad50